MASSAERMKSLRERRRAQGLREIRIVVPDIRLPEVQRELARQVATLDPDDEREVMQFIEAVNWFDNDNAEG
jgi:hypothetical protein